MKSVPEQNLIPLDISKFEEVRARHEREYSAWRDMWAEGLTLREMGRRLGKSTNAVGQQILALRRRYGWFPPRKPHSTLIDESQYAAWREMWSRGETIAAIAETLGLPRGAIMSKIYALRKRFGWFPDRVADHHKRGAKRSVRTR